MYSERKAIEVRQISRTETERGILKCPQFLGILHTYVPRSLFKYETVWPTLKAGAKSESFTASICCRYWTHITATAPASLRLYLQIRQKTNRTNV